MALGQLDGVAIGILDPGNVIFASGEGVRLALLSYYFSLRNWNLRVESAFGFYEISTIRKGINRNEGRAQGAEGKALSAGREQEETTAKQARPISVENLFMAISSGWNFQPPFIMILFDLRNL